MTICISYRFQLRKKKKADKRIAVYRQACGFLKELAGWLGMVIPLVSTKKKNNFFCGLLVDNKIQTKSETLMELIFRKLFFPTVIKCVLMQYTFKHAK